MAQNTLTSSIIAAEAVMILENSLVMAKTVHRGYEDEFDKKINGYTVGESISIRRPTDFTVRSGAVASAQEVKEGKLTFTVNTQKGVDFKFTSKDLTMNIKDLSDRVMKPALVQLANQVDRDVMALYKKCPNWVGTPGGVVNTFAKFYSGPQRLNEFAVPEDGRASVLSPADHAGLLGSQTGLFITGPAESAYRRANLGALGDVDTYMSQNVPTHTVGALGGTPLINGANQVSTYETVKDGTPMQQTLVTDGWSNSITGLLKAGDIITIANVNAVNPVTKDVLPFNRQFVVLSDANSDGSGNSTLTISPPIITSGAFQTVNAAPADNAAITVLGSAATGYRQNMVYHKNAYGLVMVPMVEPPGAPDVSRKTYKGTSVRVIPVYDGVNDFSMWRLDILYGVEAIDPRLATRLSG